MKVFLESLSSAIVLEGSQGNHQERPVTAISQGFKSLADMIKYLGKTYGLSEKIADYARGNVNTLKTARLVVNRYQFGVEQWFTPTQEELQAWHAGDLKLYNEAFIIHFHYVR